MDDRRLIEDYLPIQAISAEAFPELVRIQNPAVRLDHAKREIAAARLFEIPVEAIATAGEMTK